jgi:hypothetical protein
MKRLLQEIQLEKEEEEQQKEAEEKRQLKQLILDSVQEYDSFDEFMQKEITEAAKENRDTIYLITLPERDPTLFPDCKGSKISQHTEDNCYYVTFIADVFNELLDKNLFDIKLEYIGRPCAGCMDIYVKFTI